MTGYIAKDDLIELLSDMQGRCGTKAELRQNSKIWNQVKDMPTVDAIPVGWIKKYMSRCLAIEQDAIGEMIKEWAERKEE